MKRTRDMDPVAETLRIRLRGSTDDPTSSQVLEADKATVQYWSSCARGLPAAAEELDLSQLLLEGQPVQRDTVVCWLNSVYGIVDGGQFEEQDTEPSSTMAGLAQLLAFAHAVGSRRGLLLSLDEKVSAAGALVAEVQMGEQQLRLKPTSCCFHLDPAAPSDLYCLASGSTAPRHVASISSAADQEGMRQQLVQQLEALLYLAYKLQLPQLQRLMRRCIACNNFHPTSLLGSADSLRSVVSARVVDAAVSCGAAQSSLINHNSTEAAAFSTGLLGGPRQVFRPLGLTAEQRQSTKFEAEVVQDIYCFEAGQVVNVDLNLFNSAMTVRPEGVGMPSMLLPVHLVLGQHLNSP